MRLTSPLINQSIDWITFLLEPTELEEILAKGRAPSPVLEMPQQYPLLHQQQQPSPSSQPYMNENYMPNGNNGSNTFPSPRQSVYNQQPPMNQPYGPNDNNSSTMYPSPRPPMYNNYSNYSPPQPQMQPPPPPPPQQQQSNNPPNGGKPDFQRFYGPVSISMF